MRCTPAILTALTVLVSACASQYRVLDATDFAGGTPPRIPRHHSVQEVTVESGSRGFALLAHVAVNPPPGEVRAHLGSETGLTGLDVGVVGGEVHIYTVSALAGVPGLPEKVAADLARVWGARSVFALPTPLPPASRLEGDASDRLAFPLADGSWIAASASAFSSGHGDFAALLLDPRLRSEAIVEYADFDDSGVPCSVTLRDFADCHVTRIEVAETRPVTTMEVTR